MIQKNRYDVLRVLIQLIGWGIVFGFPFFFTWKGGSPMTWTRYLGYVFVPVTFVVVFYLNYFVLIDRILFRKRLLHFLLANLALFVVMSLGIDLWQGFYFEHWGDKTPPTRPVPPRMMFLLRDGMMMVLTAALSVAIRMTDNWYTVENEKKELEKARTEAELQNLKSQLNPHFLFNTLNNIYSLIAIDADRAQYAVHDLSRMLRYVLYEDCQKQVPLEREVTFMKSYIELMSLRLPGNVSLEMELDAGTEPVMVTPLLFITLVENAFKHGVSPVEKSYIRIAIGLRCGGHEVFCRTENSCFPKRDQDRSGSGIGLENLRKRLGLLYPGRHSLCVGREDGSYVAELKITV